MTDKTCNTCANNTCLAFDLENPNRCSGWKEKKKQIPFNLERAKAGESFFRKVTCHEYRFVGFGTNLTPAIEDVYSGILYWLVNEHDYYMKPKKRILWVNLYPNGDAYYHFTEEFANKEKMSNRIGNKAYPVEIEE